MKLTLHSSLGSIVGMTLLESRKKMKDLGAPFNDYSEHPVSDLDLCHISIKQMKHSVKVTAGYDQYLEDISGDSPSNSSIGTHMPLCKRCTCVQRAERNITQFL